MAARVSFLVPPKAKYRRAALRGHCQKLCGLRSQTFSFPSRFRQIATSFAIPYSKGELMGNEKQDFVEPSCAHSWA